MNVFAAVSAAVIALSSGSAGNIPEKETVEDFLLEPSDNYAQWGNLAMREASKKHYEIYDYLYVGKRSLDSDRTERTFKFQVKKNGKEFALYVTVTAQESTDRLLDIKFKEVQK